MALEIVAPYFDTSWWGHCYGLSAFSTCHKHVDVTHPVHGWECLRMKRLVMCCTQPLIAAFIPHQCSAGWMLTSSIGWLAESSASELHLARRGPDAVRWPQNRRHELVTETLSV